MNDLINFTFKHKPVRVILIEGDPWWVALDLCAVLGLTNVTMALKKLRPDQLALNRIEGENRGKPVNCVCESGMWTLVLRSDRPEAVEVQRWLTGDVLPKLRKFGFYQMPGIEPDPPQLPRPAIEDAEIPRLTAAIGIMREARQIWVREECRRIWMKIGLPSPVANSEADDPFIAQVADIIGSTSQTTTETIAQALGKSLDQRLSLRIGAALRMLDWMRIKAHVAGRSIWVWRPILGGDAQ